MRYSAAEKLEIIRLLEQSSLPARRTLAQLGMPGAAALSDGQPAPRRVWNKLPEEVAAAVLELAAQLGAWLTSTSAAGQPFSTGGKRSN
jgi:putative transposase